MECHRYLLNFLVLTLQLHVWSQILHLIWGNSMFFYLWQSTRTPFLHCNPYCCWLSHNIAGYPPPSQGSKLWRPIPKAWCNYVGFCHSRIFYATALAVIIQLTPITRYLPILRHVCIIFGALACGLLLRIIVPPFGLLVLVLGLPILVLWVCTSLLLLYDSQILQSISEATSNAFNKLFGRFQDSFQSLRQAASRPFNSSSMPAANSTETSGENGSN